MDADANVAPLSDRVWEELGSEEPVNSDGLKRNGDHWWGRYTGWVENDTAQLKTLWLVCHMAVIFPHLFSVGSRRTCHVGWSKLQITWLPGRIVTCIAGWNFELLVCTHRITTLIQCLMTWPYTFNAQWHYHMYLMANDINCHTSSAQDIIVNVEVPLRSSEATV